MSDTDDTDVLLLIPPDFFLVNSDTDSSFDESFPEHCNIHCRLVKNLTEEVSVIKNKLNSIESHSEISSFRSLDSINELNMSARQFQYNEDHPQNDYRQDRRDFKYNSNSAKSTPQKPRTKLVNSSLPSTPSDHDHPPLRYRRGNTEYGFLRRESPKKTHSVHSIPYDRDADESSINSSPEKNKTVLGEIDQFLSHVKTIKRYVTQRKLENEFPDKTQSLPNDLITFDNSPLKLSDLKGEGDVRDKRKTLDLKDVDRLLESMEKQKQKMEKNDRIVEGTERQTYTWKMGDNKNSVPDHNLGMRDIMYNEDAKVSKNFPKTDLHPSESSDNSAPTVYEKSSEEIFTKKLQPTYEKQFLMAPPKNVTNEKHEDKNMQPKRYPYNFEAEPYKNLLGLTDLWTKSKDEKNTSSFILTKLEEEKLRRQHCEKLIQELQYKHLEMQQRLAISVQVDCAKDAAILKFHEAWEKVADRWQSLETERNQLAVKLSSIKGKSDFDIAEANKKVLHYETEMSKALDLAHTCQEKCNNLEFEKNTLSTELDTVKSELDNLKKKLNNIDKEKKDLTEKLIEMEKLNLQDKKTVLDLQKEISVQKQKSQKDIHNCQNEIKHLREDKNKLEKEVLDSRRSNEVLENKNRSLENVVENSKKTEKTLQKEINKLHEQADKVQVELRNFYQQQVDILVKDKLKEFESHLEETEKQLHEELQNREQNIAKTAAKQLQKLSDKHNIEVQLLEEKHKEEINLYEIQISQLRHLIASQQTKLDHMQQKRNNIAHELKSVMEQQWSEALRIINNGRTPAGTPTGIDIPKYRLRDDMDLKKILVNDELRDQIPENEKQDASVNTVGVKTQNVPEANDLQRYIKMLLDKEPKLPADDRDRRTFDNPSTASASHDISSFPKVSGADVVSETDKKSVKEHRHKPPWK